MTRLIVKLPDVEGITSQDFIDSTDRIRRIEVRDALVRKYGPKVQVMIDDRPEPMDFVKEIRVLHNREGVYIDTEVHFNNGTRICSCYSMRGHVLHRDIPSLRIY